MGKLYIRDLLGERVEVADLPKAIEQCRNFASMTSYPPARIARNVTCQQYWKDAYEKLLELEKALTPPEKT